LGDPRNKLRRQVDGSTRADTATRRRDGFVVFHFDFKPSLTQRDLTLGEAIRHLLRVTGSSMTFWRCPVRGLAVRIKKLPTTSYAYDGGESWMMLHFSDLEDEVAAKKVLVLDLLLSGIELYRGLPNAVFEDQVSTIKWLLTAPPSVPAEKWRKVLERVHPKTRPLLATHEADLRFHLLGEKYRGPTGPVAMSARVRMDEFERRGALKHQ
jgi:hypothetical protein